MIMMLMVHLTTIFNMIVTNKFYVIELVDEMKFIELEIVNPAPLFKLEVNELAVKTDDPSVCLAL